MARNPLARDLTLYDVVVEEHRVAPRWTVPRTTARVGGVSIDSAKYNVLARAQSDAGVPPWKPCRREGWRHVSAYPVTVSVIR